MNEIQAFLLGKGVTPRQAEIGALICEGHDNFTIGAKLFIEEKSVKCHLTWIYRRCGVKTRLELAVLVLNEMRARLKAPADTAPLIAGVRRD